MTDFMWFMLGMGVGLIIFSGSWLLFQWPKTRKLMMQNQDRKDMIKENNELRKWRENARAKISDFERKTLVFQDKISLLEKQSNTYKAQAQSARKALEDALEDADDVDDNAVKVRTILDLSDEGKSQREIQQAVFGYVGGHAYDVVTGVLNGDITE
jgi:hypothetical protein